MDGISEEIRLEILAQCSGPAVDIVDALRDVAERNQAFENCSLYVQAANEIDRLRKLASDAHAAWDKDRDMTVGKLLRAMLDEKFCKTYRPDLTHN